MSGPNRAITTPARRPVPRARPVVVALVLLLVAAIATPVQAAVVLRTWRGSVGTDGVNGTHSLIAYDDASGALRLNLKGLRAGTRFTIEVRAKSCASLGGVLFSSTITTSSTGTVVSTKAIPSAYMNTVWSYARSYGLAVRYASASQVRCGNLSFYRATRIRIPDYRIDLPVIKSPSGYPYCNVAMYMKELFQPREPRVTYIHGHARTGMFLPLLKASQVNNGAGMIGRMVYVYTSDSRMIGYQITRVRRHVSSIQSVFGITSEVLWIQTSEGPNYTYPKLIIEAKRVSNVAAAYSSSHPVAKPISC